MLTPNDMQINKGKYTFELDDPEYCPCSYSHQHAWDTDLDNNENVVTRCELCGVIES